jgi:hypothetical protein
LENWWLATSETTKPPAPSVTNVELWSVGALILTVVADENEVLVVVK